MLILAAENILRVETDLVCLLNVRTIKGVDTDLEFLNPLTGKIENEHRQHSHNILKKAAAFLKHQNFLIKAISLRGDARDEITRKTEELNADLLIVGNRGMGGISRYFFNVISRALVGSTSDFLIHHVHCPVLVVRKE